MKRRQFNSSSLIGAGAAAGLVGTGVMLAMLWFDEKYAPKTVAAIRQNPAPLRVPAFERACSDANAVPTSRKRSVSLAIRAASGTTFGILYAHLRGQHKSCSALGDGIVLGAIAYVASQLGCLHAVSLTKPVWKQDFPQVAGELLRHVAFGVATTAAYRVTEVI